MQYSYDIILMRYVWFEISRIDRNEESALAWKINLIAPSPKKVASRTSATKNDPLPEALEAPSAPKVVGNEPLPEALEGNIDNLINKAA